MYEIFYVSLLVITKQKPRINVPKIKKGEREHTTMGKKKKNQICKCRQKEGGEMELEHKRIQFKR